MNRSTKTSIALASALLASGWAYAQQPPDVVQSDVGDDTAMGTGALQSLTPSLGQFFTGGFNDTAVGFNALYSNSVGANNTATGTMALASNSYGNANTANGSFALSQSTTGNNNTASGISALQDNTTGNENTASGSGALFYSATGDDNTAAGYNALNGNTTGSYNTASGSAALYSNTSGSYNTATGNAALWHNTTGNYNNAAGLYALTLNTTGYRNEASGAWALQFNTVGHDNTAAGQGALLSNTTGSYNIGLGENAGYYVTTGNNNIEIGNFGNAADARLIRIGTQSVHTATYIAGIGGAHVTGSAVYITATGQLGVLASSERYKTAIAPMGQSSEKLQQLRPVTFQLKTDPKGEVQYGLIAEEVAKVYPELVIRDDIGKIQGVRYEELAPMLLNEAQQQRQEIGQLKHQLEQLQAAFTKLQSKDELVAQR
jgi:hypothetical protein